MINLQDKRLKGIDIDSRERVLVHKKILKTKRMIQEVFKEFHILFDSIDREYFSGIGGRLEIGAGASHIKESFPDVLSSDIVMSEDIDLVIDATNINLPNSSLRTIFAQNVFHHISDPNKFFNELDRVLVPGGGAILIEPYYGVMASIFYKRISKYEHFDKKQELWTSRSINPMSGANQALSYIVFVRDRLKFENNHPHLEIILISTIGNYLRYILSGGINFIQLAPDFLIPPLKFFEKILSPFKNILALHYLIVIRKKK
jgi:SAM-dependent methyltransferase